MGWILILIVQGWGGSNIPAITQIDFGDEKACHAAFKAIRIPNLDVKAGTCLNRVTGERSIIN